MDSDNLQDDEQTRTPADRAWFGRRKRVAAREIGSSQPHALSEIEQEMKASATGGLKPADVIDIPSGSPRRPPEVLLDPTLFSERQRKRGQNFTYHLTQTTLTTGFFSACAAIVSALLEHRLRAELLAVAACLLGVVSVRLVRMSRLAYRLRGYVAATCVLGGIALAISLLPSFTHDGGKSVQREKPPASAEHP